MKTDWKGVVAVLFAAALVIAMLAGVAGIIWRGDKISTEGSVIIGMLIGAIVVIGAAYLGIFLTFTQIRIAKVYDLWPQERNRENVEDTLVNPSTSRR